MNINTKKPLLTVLEHITQVGRGHPGESGWTLPAPPPPPLRPAPRSGGGTATCGRTGRSDPGKSSDTANSCRSTLPESGSPRDDSEPTNSLYSKILKQSPDKKPNHLNEQ